MSFSLPFRTLLGERGGSDMGEEGEEERKVQKGEGIASTWGEGKWR